MIEFRALGPLVVVIDGMETPVGGPRQRRLLAMLLIHRGDVVSVDRLAEAVFDGEPTEAARTTMRSYIARIRKVINCGAPDVELVTKAPGYGLRVPAGSLDVDRFESLLADGRRQLGTGDATVAAVSLRQALGTWRGDAFAEFADEEWAMPEAQRLEELRLVAVERLVDAELACGRATESIPRLEALVGEHPLREGFRGQLMLALYRSGRQVDALRSYREYRTTLADEIGLDPSPALVELERRILEHDSSLDLVEAAGEPLRGYRLGARLGVGPNGIAHEAHVEGVPQSMVISILDDPLVDEPAFVQTFEANAQRIASITHPAVVGIHDYWREPGAAYVVTRRVGGDTWRTRLERASIDRSELERLVVRVGGALAEASARGIEHGWVTLDNVVLDGQGQPCITNFVVSPTGHGHDIGDFATVVRASVERCRPPLPAHVHEAISAVLDTPPPAIDRFVADLTDALATTIDRTADVPNPFKGLRAFDETDASDFHGRDELITELVRRVARPDGCRLTLVVGGSGSGKSSVVRAGMVPAVRDGAAGPGWFVTTMLPGSAPFKELAEALRRVAVCDLDNVAARLRDGDLSIADVVAEAVPEGGSVLIVVDQFEELFTLASDEVQVAFLDLLAASVEGEVGPVHVVATLRADFYDRPLGFQRFGALVGRSTVTVPAMTPAGLESAIVRPVEAVGGSVDPALVAELVAAVANQPAALPALQFTLYELAERRSDRSLAIDDYRQLGGIDEAIATRAEQLYLANDNDGRRTVREMFEQLVVVDLETEPTGRRSPLVDLTDRSAPMQSAVAQWAASRLLTLDHDPRTRVPTVQVAHEAILRSWPRLRQWISEDRDELLERQHLRDAAAEWQRLKRDDAALYRGARLDSALGALPVDAALPTSEREFLDASRHLRDMEERQAQDRIDAQSRANRRLRWQLAAIGVALVVALVVGFVALDQRRRAQDQRALAQDQRAQAEEERTAADAARRDATARELAAASEANVTLDPERSILLAQLAIETTRSVDGTVLPEAIDALHRAVTSSRVLTTVPEVGGRLDWNPVGDTFVTEGPEDSGMVDIRDATTGESVRSWRGDAIDVNDVVFSRDGTKLAVAGDDGILKVFDPATGELLSSTEGKGSVWDPSFTADGTTLLAQWTNEEVIRRVDVDSGAVKASVDGVVQHLEISPEGQRVVVGNLFEPPFNTIVKVDAPLEPVVVLVPDVKSNVSRWSPDGTRVAAAGEDGFVRVYDATTGTIVASASTGVSSVVVTLDWSADGTSVASGGYDGAVTVWDIDEGTMRERVRLQAQEFAGGVAGIAFSGDGERVAVGDWAITAAKVFDVTAHGGAEVANIPAEPSGGGAVTAQSIVSVSPDWFVQIHEARTGAPVAVRREAEVSTVVAVDPSGTKVAMQPWVREADAPGDVIEISEVGSAAVLATVDVSDSPWIDALAWTPDGAHLVAARSVDDGRSADVVVFDASTGERVADHRLDGFYVSSVAVSADGGRVAIARSQRERSNPDEDLVEVWDWLDDTVVDEIPIRATHLAYDASGAYLALTRFNDGRAEVVDADTGDPVTTLSGSEAPLNSVAFTADGASVVTGGQDGTVRLWDPSSGGEVRRFVIGQPVLSAVTDPSGTRLLSLDQSGLARVWTLDLDELLSIAGSRVTRDLTDAECRRFLNADSCAAAGAV